MRYQLAHIPPAELARLWKAGIGTTEIGQLFGCHANTVRARARSMLLPDRPWAKAPKARKRPDGKSKLAHKKVSKPEYDPKPVITPPAIHERGDFPAIAAAVAREGTSDAALGKIAARFRLSYAKLRAVEWAAV